MTVTLGGQTKTATADACGKWSVRFDALQAGGPLQLQAKGEKNTVTVSDVLVGEVWLCSGQSNMEMSVWGVANKDAEIAAANHPQIRMYFIDHIPAKEPQAQRNGRWAVCSPQTVGGFSAAAYFFGRELHKQLNVPVGLINSSWGGTPVQTWTSIKCARGRARVEADGRRSAPAGGVLRQRKGEGAVREAVGRLGEGGRGGQGERKAVQGPEAAAAAGPGAFALGPRGALQRHDRPAGPLRHPRRDSGTRANRTPARPSTAFNSQTMIANWRDDWKQGDFPFLFVQLPNFMGPQTQPSESVGGWPLEREQFLKMLDTVKNTGMAVTIDIGEANDIHPHNKQDVGKRLAQWALAKTYGKDVVASGPLYKSSRQEAGKIVVEFNYVGGGLASRDGGKLTGFAIAGADKKFVWADAQIVGDTVVVSSPAVPSPVAVRYAWANNPPCNLVNKAGLPASPFRTDDWK